jgi:GT2 family glycosyltransferase
MCDVSIAIVSWNTRALLHTCLQSIIDSTHRIVYEIIVVDNASSDGSAEMVAHTFPMVRLIRNHQNQGFAQANNAAFVNAHGRYLLLLNPDTEVHIGAIDTLVDYMDQHADVGALGAHLLNADGSTQISCSHFPTLANMALESLGISRLAPRSALFARFKMTYWLHDQEREVDQPSGACLLIRRVAWDQVGSLDTRFFMYFEEVDLCYRIKRQGWKIVFIPSAYITHYGGQSSLQNMDVRIIKRYESLLAFFKKHYCQPAVFALRLLVVCEMLWRVLFMAGRFLPRNAHSADAREIVACYAQVALLYAGKQPAL